MKGERHSLDYSGEKHPSVSRLRSGLSLVGGGTAWLLHLLAVYVISEFGCRAGWGDWLVGPVSMVAWLLLLATLATALLAGGATLASAGAARLLQGKGGDDSVVAAENKLFVSRVSLILNAVFVFVILVQAIPIFFYLRAC